MFEKKSLNWEIGNGKFRFHSLFTEQKGFQPKE